MTHDKDEDLESLENAPELDAAPHDESEEEAEALAEFDSYESLDEDLVLEVQELSDEDREALVTPKDRRLAAMRLEARIEAVIFASQRPLKSTEILEILADPTLSEADVQVSIDNLMEFYEDRAGGFRLHYLKRLGYQFQTVDAAGAIMERMFASRPRPISRAALETLAIIAYRQPVTRAEVEFIRGVDAGSIFKTLLERDLIKCVGRKEIVGRPMIFGTTDDFLKVFNLSSIKELPPLESFQPSREVVQGAMEKLEGSDEPEDIEKYIAANLSEDEAGEEASEDFAAMDDDSLDHETSELDSDRDEGLEEVPDEETERSELFEAAQLTKLAGASLAQNELLSEPSDKAGGDASDASEASDGNNADSEVVVPDGDSLEKTGRELD